MKYSDVAFNQMLKLFVPIKTTGSKTHSFNEKILDNLPGSQSIHNSTKVLYKIYSKM